jgi:Kef-type K+ transport system membrane component KefB
MTKNTKLLNYNKLEISIIVVSIMQIINYLLMLLIIYTTSRDDNPSDFDGLGAIVPAYIFIFFGVINILLVTIYLIGRYRRRSKPSSVVIILAAVPMIFFVFGEILTNLVDGYKP